MPRAGANEKVRRMPMTSRERMLTALDNGRPDRLPCQVHGWMPYYLQHYLGGMDAWQAYERFGMDFAIYVSPAFYRTFGLPYDRRQNALFRELGLKVVNHFCGGLMPMLDLVVESGADGLETMTPPSMGGDCDLAESSRRVGGQLFFIGGFDQKTGFERGTPETARRLVRECFEATKEHAGYILCPSDHFFHGDPACLQAFADEAKACRY